METYATATIPKYLLFNLSIVDLEENLTKFPIELKAIKIQEESVILKLYGSKEEIRKAVKDLYSIINKQVKNLSLTDKKIASKIPGELKNYLKKLANNDEYRDHYEQHANRYIEDCLANEINPHPEIIEAGLKGHFLYGF